MRCGGLLDWWVSFAVSNPYTNTRLCCVEMAYFSLCFSGVVMSGFRVVASAKLFGVVKVLHNSVIYNMLVHLLFSAFRR